MRSGILAGLIVVVLGAGAVAAEQPAQVMPGDIFIMASGAPSDPVVRVAQDPNWTWDPAEHLLADWEYVSVSMTSQVYNPAYEPDNPPQGPQWSLSIRAFVDLLDSTGLIGWSMTPASVVAYDQDGTVVARSAPSTMPIIFYQRPISSLGRVAFNRFSLALPVEPNAAYPDVLSRVEWTMNLLVAEETTTVNVPFAPDPNWVELAPGMEIMVEQATVEDSTYEYRLNLRYNPTKVDYLLGGAVTLWNDETLPAAALLKMEVISAEGQTLGGGGSSSASGSSSLRTGTMNGHGSCAACGTATTFRFTLVSGLHEQEATFVLEDIPVPVF